MKCWLRLVRCSSLLLLSFLLVLAGPLLAAAESWTAPSAVTSLEFSAAILADLGLELVAVEPSADDAAFPGISFRTRPGSLLEFRAPHGDFERFDAGQLLHEGGFALRVGEDPRLIDLSGFALRVAPPPADFELLDATGQSWFVLRDMQFTASWARQELQLLNVSIHLAEALAERIARPDLALAYVGTANLSMPALLPPESAGGAAGAAACTPTAGPIDVALTAIDSVSQLAREPGVRVALAPSAALMNVGSGSVDWYEAIEPLQFQPGGVGPHPNLSMSMLRLGSDGRLVQIGVSDVKHAFRALNLDCSCPSGPILYPECRDVYGVSTNANRRFLAPREGVTAHTGAWQRVGSHFDQCLAIETPPCEPAIADMDDFRDHQVDGSPVLYHDAFDHLLVVRESALEVPGATYFVEAWYLVAGDVDIFNSMGRRTVVPMRLGNTWSFAFDDAGLTNGSVLDVIPGAQPVTLDTGEGLLQLASTTADQGDGVVHYEYALVNFDFDRQIDGFSVPLAPGVTITNADSSPPGDDPAGAWTIFLADEAISWQAPPGAALDWGTLVSFGFDADAPPVASAVSVVALEQGPPGGFAISAPAPVPEPAAPVLAAASLAALASLRRSGRSKRVEPASLPRAG